MMARVTGIVQRPSRVLVVGDANPDLVLRGDVVPRFAQAEQLLDTADLVLGGSAAITAHGLARLDRPVTLLAAVGDDLFGRDTVGRLESAGVDTRFVLVRKETSTGLTVVLSTPDDRAILTLLGTIPTLSGGDVLDAVDALRPGGLAHVHFSSLFLQQTLAGQLAGVLVTLREAGLTTSLDTNADPALRWDGVTELLPHLDVLLPNRTEVTQLARRDDPMAAARALAGAGPLVVVKDGAKGGFAVRRDGDVVEVAARPRTVIDTTGAGDTFDAGFLDAWLTGSDLVTCLSRAVRAGSFAVSAAGGTAGQPTQADLSGTSQ